MRLAKLREMVGLLLSAEPEPTRFPDAEPEIAARFRGVPEPREDRCIGCGACASVCPAGAITTSDDAAARVRKFELDLGKCVFCARCAEACPTGDGITSSSKYDTAMLNRSEGVVRWEKRLAVCEIDGAVVAAEDHLKWIAERVHELGYSNPSLIISATAELGVGIEPSGRPDDAQPGRGDEFRVLCPRCRRAVLLREAWG